MAAAGVLQAMPTSHPRHRRQHRARGRAHGVGRDRRRTVPRLVLPVPARSLLDDGLLDVCTIDALNPAAVAELVPLIATGQHLGRPDSVRRGTSVIVERADGLPLVAESDGSVLTRRAHT